jgi:hypothetical protein
MPQQQKNMPHHRQRLSGKHKQRGSHDDQAIRRQAGARHGRQPWHAWPAQAGARAVLASRSEEELAHNVDAIKANGGEATAVVHELNIVKLAQGKSILDMAALKKFTVHERKECYV